MIDGGTAASCHPGHTTINHQHQLPVTLRLPAGDRKKNPLWDLLLEGEGLGRFLMACQPAPDTQTLRPIRDEPRAEGVKEKERKKAEKKMETESVEINKTERFR